MILSGWLFVCLLCSTKLQVEDEQNCPSAFDELGELAEGTDFIRDENTVISQKQGKTMPKKVHRPHPPEKRIQYATRGKKHSYCEAEVPDDDHYICKLN